MPVYETFHFRNFSLSRNMSTDVHLKYTSLLYWWDYIVPNICSLTFQYMKYFILYFSLRRNTITHVHLNAHHCDIDETTQSKQYPTISCSLNCMNTSHGHSSGFYAGTLVVKITRNSSKTTIKVYVISNVLEHQTRAIELCSLIEEVLVLIKYIGHANIRTHFVE